MHIVMNHPVLAIETATGDSSEDVDLSWRDDAPGLLDTSGIDMYTEGGQLIVEMPLAEFKQDEITVIADAHGFEVSAMRKVQPQEFKDRTYLLRGGRWSFWRHVSLPLAARQRDLRYTLIDGKLRVEMPLTLSKAVANNRHISKAFNKSASLGGR